MRFYFATKPYDGAVFSLGAGEVFSAEKVTVQLYRIYGVNRAFTGLVDLSALEEYTLPCCKAKWIPIEGDSTEPVPYQCSKRFFKTHRPDLESL